MARLAALEFGADWIIHNDADEFWWPVFGNLKNCFAGLADDINVVVAERSNFIYTRNPWYRRNSSFLELIYREVASKNVLGHPLPPKIAHRSHPEVVMPTGNHSVENIGPHKTAYNLIEIFHYPVRSRSQLLDKIQTGCRAVAQHEDKQPGGTLGTWKLLHQQTRLKGGFESLMSEQTYSNARIWRELIGGKIVRDPRLRDFIKKLD